MALGLSRKQHAQLLEWADAAGKHECCGLLLGEAETVFELELTENVAVDTSQHFEIDSVALISRHKAARDGGLPIIGYFHSHPNGLARPSETDVMQAADDRRYWLIIANREITAWKPRGGAGRVTEFESIALIVEG